MKNPNGYGTVVKLSGNRRRPYAIRKTTGWNEKGHPIYQSIGYAETREEGMMMLAEFNRDPWDVDTRKVTLKELFELFKEKRLEKMNTSNKHALKSNYRFLKRIEKLPYREINSLHMQDCIDNCGLGYATQNGIKSLLSHLDRFALELDVIDKSYAQLTKTAKVPDTSRNPFSEAEIKKLWENVSMPWADSVLIFIYTGFRISELLNIKIADVDLNAGTLKGGSKTAAGKDRIVPIHSKIMPLVKARIDQGGEYLVSHSKRRMANAKYYEFWNDVMKNLDMMHTPHECRHTFRTLLDSAGANSVSIDLMMGHKSSSVGARVYTHKTILELKQAIELITH